MSLCFKEISYPCSLFHTKASIVDIHDTSFQFMLRLFLKDSKMNYFFIMEVFNPTWSSCHDRSVVNG